MKFSQLVDNVDRQKLEEWCRAHTQQACVGDGISLCRVLGNHLMYVDTFDVSLAPHMLMNGFWEMWVTQAICQYVKPGMNCIDVGANCGYYTLLLSELTDGKGQVVAYEPYRRLARLLEKTLLVNGISLTSAQVLERAASNASEGSRALFFSDVQLGRSSLKYFLGAGMTAVACSRIDTDLHSMKIDFMKIDVQGHEMEVLEGAEETIKRSQKIAIAMEFTPSEHQDPRAAIALIRDRYGLTVRTIGTDGAIRPITDEEAVKAETGDHRMLWLSKG